MSGSNNEFVHLIVRPVRTVFVGSKRSKCDTKTLISCANENGRGTI